MVGIACLFLVAGLVCFKSEAVVYNTENAKSLLNNTMALSETCMLDELQICLDEITLTDLCDGAVQADFTVAMEAVSTLPDSFLLRAAVVVTETDASRKLDLPLQSGVFPVTEHILFTLPAGWQFFEVIFRGDGIDEQASFRFSREDLSAVR